ncbi:hypothetical protein KSP40_PGU003961 [Platanthera guangdongensis]|uniref:C2H2-type domain-containing protein n=1 Tax=Platanthera guangdongensis TaxID=2320717 RepID=A0ABR2LPI0_9ASPA
MAEEADALISCLPPDTSMSAGSVDSSSSTLLFDNLSLLRHKIKQLHSFIAAAFVSTDIIRAEAAAAAVHADTLINDMVAAASSILFSLPKPPAGGDSSPDVVELDAGMLLAKQTNNCHVCGKGFQRDANLRMHMRAHGEEYKTRAALESKEKKKQSCNGRTSSSKYSCPEEGCRCNARHDKFRPLKSVACAKNHYRRRHCPKLYLCSRCRNKGFSVLSDLRTHEKHCGIPRWRCSCGSTFSRKDKLLRHATLFACPPPAPTIDAGIIDGATCVRGG